MSKLSDCINSGSKLSSYYKYKTFENSVSSVTPHIKRKISAVLSDIECGEYRAESDCYDNYFYDFNDLTQATIDGGFTPKLGYIIKMNNHHKLSFLLRFSKL